MVCEPGTRLRFEVAMATEIPDFPGGTFSDVSRIVVGNISGRASL